MNNTETAAMGGAMQEGVNTNTAPTMEMHTTLGTGMPGESMGMGAMTADLDGPMVLGFPLIVFLMIASGVFYAACAAFVGRMWLKEKNELVAALFAFLSYQAASMFFMGLEMQTMNMFYSNMASLAVFVGSVYMLKFPFSSFSNRTRQTFFFGSLIAVLGLFAWFLQTEVRQISLMNFTLWYDIVVNGLVVGGFMFLLALRTAERWLKFKAYGGSLGVLTCCVAANATILTGALLTSSVLQFLAPVIILGSLVFAHRGQKTSAPVQTA